MTVHYNEFSYGHVTRLQLAGIEGLMTCGVRTRQTFTDSESGHLLRGFLSGAVFDAGLICRADDRGDPVIQLAPPLTCTQEHFGQIGQILRTVLAQAWTRP